MKAGYGCNIKECKLKHKKHDLELTDISSKVIWAMAFVFFIFLVLIMQ